MITRRPYVALLLSEMDRLIFTYLKKKGLADIRIVNRLFVSAFLGHYNMVPIRNALLREYLIAKHTEDYTILQDFDLQLKKYGCTYSLEDLTTLFEFVISPSDRKISGAIYTPEYIRERIVNEVTADIALSELHNKRFADIACGCGGFFLTIANLLHRKLGKSFADIYRKNIFGIDIQDYAIERTKLLLSLLALINGEDENFDFNLHVANSLNFDFSSIKPIDIIVGNPPYVCARNMSDENRLLLKNWSVCSAGNSDLYIPFFQIATEVIENGGKVGFITMNSFLTSLNGRVLREYFSEKSYEIKIVDFRGYQLFKGKSTYTCLFFLTKNHSDSLSYFLNPSALLPSNFLYELYPYSGLKNKEGWQFNGTITYTVPTDITLSEYCKTRHGIATLKNKVYVFKPIGETDFFYLLEKNGRQYCIEKDICRDIVNSNKFNSDVKIEDITEKVIFPYQLNNAGQAEILPEDKFKETYPSTYEYMLSQKELLVQRDKGKTGHYPTWYAYGRTQSLTMPRYKLFFPKIANRKLRCVISEDPNLLLYNGISFVDDNIEKIKILKLVLESESFWSHVIANAKPYSSGYYSISGQNVLSYVMPHCIIHDE